MENINGNNGLTKYERWLKLVMFVSALTYFIVGMLFLFAPNGTFYIFNFLGDILNIIFKKWSISIHFDNIIDINERFWLTLAVSMMITIAVCSFISQLNIRRNISFVIPVLFSKMTTTTIVSVLFLANIRNTGHTCFVYPAIAATDGSLFLITAVSYYLAISNKITDPLPKLKYFKPNQYKIMSALADVIVPKGGGIKYSAADLDTGMAIDRFFLHGSPIMKNFFPFLLMFFEYGTNVFFKPMSRFTNLGKNEQSAYLEGFQKSRFASLRLAFLVLKTVVMQGFYFNDKVWSEISYAGPWTKDIKKW